MLRRVDPRVLGLTIGNGAVIVLNQAMGIVLSRLLTLDQYATFRQTFLAFDFVAPLFLLGLPNAVLYLLSNAKGQERSVVSDALAITGLSALCFGLAHLLGGSSLLTHRFKNPALAGTAGWLPFYALSILPAAVVPPVLIWAHRARQAATYRVLGSSLAAALAITAVIVGTGVRGAVAARVVGLLVMLPVGLWLLHRLRLSGRARPESAAMRRMIVLALPLGLAGAIGTVAVQLHSIIVALLTTPEEFAIYANGAVELPLVGVLTGSIAAVVLIDMSRAYSAGNRGEALAIFRSAAERSALVLLPTVALFLLVARDLMVTLYSAKYAASAVPFAMYLFVLPARIVVFGAALTAAGRTRELLWRSIGDLIVNTIACWVLVSAFGYVGAALGLVATLYLWTVPFNLNRIMAAYSCGLGEILPWRRLGLIAVCATIPAVLTLLGRDALAFMPSPARLAVIGIAYSAGLAFAYHWAGLGNPLEILAQVIGKRDQIGRLDALA